MRLFLSGAETLKDTSGCRAENPGDAKQSFQIHVPLAPLELLPMAWGEAAVSSHVILAPVPAFAKSAKPKSKCLKEFVVHYGFILRLHILGLGGYEQNNHEQDSRLGGILMTGTGLPFGLRGRGFERTVNRFGGSRLPPWDLKRGAPSDPWATSKNTTSKKADRISSEARQSHSDGGTARRTRTLRTASPYPFFGAKDCVITHAWSILDGYVHCIFS